MARRFAAFLGFAAVTILVRGRRGTDPSDISGLMSVQWQLRQAEAQGGNTFIVNPDNELGYLYLVTAQSDRYGFQNAEPWPERKCRCFPW